MEALAWTPEREARLRELYAAGVSSAQIADDLGGTTKNGVVGKVHRLGIVRPAKVKATEASIPPLKPPAKRQVLAVNVTNKVAKKAEDRREQFQAIADRALDKLNDMFAGRTEGVVYRARDMTRECSMPLPETEGGAIEDRKVCGQPVKGASSWCPACYAIVFQPPRLQEFKGRILTQGIRL